MERIRLRSFVEELSMSKHEEFEELCALAATGQLTPEEELRLSEHLDGCLTCQAAREEFSVIVRELPTSDRDILEHNVVRQIEENGFRKRFLARARAEGRRFSEEVEEDTRRVFWGFFRWLPTYQGIAAGIMIVVLASFVAFRTFHHAARNPQTVDAGKIASAPTDSNHVEDKDDKLAKRIAELQFANGASQKTTTELKLENAQLLARLEALTKELEASHAEEAELEKTVSRFSDMNGQLAGQMDQNTQVLTQTKAEMEKSRRDTAAMQAEVTAAKSEISGLSQQVRLQAASLDQDKQLLFAGRDITDLMGARNLHIIDVHDADGNGKDKQSFGRVFYTEGKSLIIYAFDLDEKKVVNAKYTFEAWGERLGQPTSVKSLGILYADDKNQRRWVLKVDDPRQLAEIDSVFVTIEPRDGGTEKPRGHKILYAFLSGQPNHP
jgi:hypothetical protein